MTDSIYEKRTKKGIQLGNVFENVSFRMVANDGKVKRYHFLLLVKIYTFQQTNLSRQKDMQIILFRYSGSKINGF